MAEIQTLSDKLNLFDDSVSPDVPQMPNLSGIQNKK